jgi:hypothetical protein
MLETTSNSFWDSAGQGREELGSGQEIRQPVTLIDAQS